MEESMTEKKKERKDEKRMKERKTETEKERKCGNNKIILKGVTSSNPSVSVNLVCMYAFLTTNHNLGAIFFRSQKRTLRRRLSWDCVIENQQTRASELWAITPPRLGCTSRRQASQSCLALRLRATCSWWYQRHYNVSDDTLGDDYISLIL